MDCGARSGVGWLARGMVTRRVETVSDFPSHADDGRYLHVAHSAMALES